MIHVTIIKVTIDNTTTSHITFGKMYALFSVTKICFNRQDWIRILIQTRKFLKSWIQNTSNYIQWGQRDQRAQRHQRAHFQIQIWRCSTNISDLKFLLIEILPFYNRFLKKNFEICFQKQFRTVFEIIFPKFRHFFSPWQQQTIFKPTKHISPQFSTILTSPALFRMCSRETFFIYLTSKIRNRDFENVNFFIYFQGLYFYKQLFFSYTSVPFFFSC